MLASLEAGASIDRKSYRIMDTWEDDPEFWGAELEAEMPPQLQLLDEPPKPLKP